MMFKEGMREQARLRVAIDGPAKSGKTTTAIRLAVAIGQRFAVLDSEHKKALYHVGQTYDGVICNFLHHAMTDFSPMSYTACINTAAQNGIATLVIDGLSPAWDGIGGVLEMHDESEERNQFAAWKTPSKVHRRLVEAILTYPGHVIVTLRSKIDYVLETDAKGRQVPRRVGLKPIQRPDLEYEFDVLATMDVDHFCAITGSRCPPMDGQQGQKPGKAFWQPLLTWLETGEVADVPQPAIRMANDEQVASIREFWQALDIVPKNAKAKLMRRHQCKEVSQLTEQQAAEYLAELQAEWLEKQKGTQPAAAAAAPAPAAPVTVASVANGTLQTFQEAGEAMKQQVVAAGLPADQRRNDLLARLTSARDCYYCLIGLTDGESEAGKKARKELWTKLLDKRGYTSATTMPEDKLLDLCQGLESRCVSLVDEQRGRPTPAAPAPKKEEVQPPGPPWQPPF
jgi:hypothetical protein